MVEERADEVLLVLDEGGVEVVEPLVLLHRLPEAREAVAGRARRVEVDGRVDAARLELREEVVEAVEERGVDALRPVAVLPQLPRVLREEAHGVDAPPGEALRRPFGVGPAGQLRGAVEVDAEEPPHRARFVDEVVALGADKAPGTRRGALRAAVPGVPQSLALHRKREEMRGCLVAPARRRKQNAREAKQNHLRHHPHGIPFQSRLHGGILPYSIRPLRVNEPSAPFYEKMRFRTVS